MWPRMRGVAAAALAGALVFGASACATQPEAPAVEKRAAEAAPAETPKAAVEVVAPTAELIEQARADLPSIYDSDCYASKASAVLTAGFVEDCVRTHPDSEFTVALVGDSHSAQWLPPVESIAEDAGWKLSYFGKRACGFGDFVPTDGAGGPYTACVEWNHALLAYLLEAQPDVVLVSNYPRIRTFEDGALVTGETNERARAEGMRVVWQQLVDNGTEVVAIVDTPYLGFNSPDCLLANLAQFESCSTPYETAVTAQPRPERIAAKLVPGVETVSLEKQFCPDGKTCAAYLNNTVVFRDEHHMTNSFAMSLHDELAEQLKQTRALAQHMKRA